MNIEEKKQAILHAVASGKVTGTQLEPSRRGTSISFLKKGKVLADITINNLYNNLIKLCPDLGHTEQTTEQTTEQKLFDTEQTTEQKLFDTEQTTEQKLFDTEQKKQKTAHLESLLRKALEQQELMQIGLHAVSERLNALEKRLSEVEKIPANKTDKKANDFLGSQEIMGFRLTQKVTRTHGKSYTKWYAVKGSDIVYIGTDLSKAEEKIKVWMGKAGR